MTCAAAPQAARERHPPFDGIGEGPRQRRRAARPARKSRPRRNEHSRPFPAAALERRAPMHTPELLRGLADVGRLCGLLSAALQARDTTALRVKIDEVLTVARTVAEELRKR